MVSGFAHSRQPLPRPWGGGRNPALQNLGCFKYAISNTVKNARVSGRLLRRRPLKSLGQWLVAEKTREGDARQTCAES